METKVHVHAFLFDLSFGYTYLELLKSLTQVLSGISLFLPTPTLYLFPFVSLWPSFFSVGMAPVCFQPFWGLAVLVTNCLNGVLSLAHSLPRSRSPSLPCYHQAWCM